ADLAAPAVLLAAAFGRAGCLLAGCCYGVVRDAGVAYPRDSHAFRDQLRHGLIGPGASESLPTAPVSLLEAGALLLLFLVTSHLWRRRLRPGRVLAAAGLLYPAWRFVAEFWRADNLPYWPGGLTFSQGLSLALIFASATALVLTPRAWPRLERPRAAFQPATALQLLLLLLTPGLSLSSVSCGSHQDREPHERSGVHVYRKTDPNAPVDRRQKPPGKDHPSKSDEDGDNSLGDCIFDIAFECTDECMEACIDAACEGACSDRPDADPSLDSILGKLQPGKKYKGSIGFEAILNQRLSVLVKLDGSLSVGKPLLDGWRPGRLRLRKASLEVGDARWGGSGDLELNVGPDGDVQLVRSSLPAEFMSALAALNALAGNLVQGIPTENALPDLRAVVEEELRAQTPKADFSLVTKFEGQERWLLGDAVVVENPPGTFRLQWRLRN
ncbi:MAG: prolipoprotein diacylglyceryl transferase, partial [Planctomycetaceae bacterium]|nr:prolipoprotein diacylglyceryl transferase [Planctomycetaceae bacterium]